MPYIGNTIRAADDYRLIDDISSGFNGNNTTFALQVAGSAPVPFPKSPQQVLISVGGVIQQPDPTGASGFNLVGTNIVFSSAPANNASFFGIIYATADYLNSGGNFPTGSLGAPSITFVGDEDTGIYRKGSGSVGFVSDATEIANFDSNGITISSGNIIIPEKIIHSGDTNTFLTFPSNDAFRVQIGGAQRLDFDSSTTVFNDDGGDIDFRIEGNTNASLFAVDAANNKIGIGTLTPDGLLHVHSGSAGSITAATDADDLVLEASSNVGLSLLTANNSLARIKFGDPDSSGVGAIVYNHQNDKLQVNTASGTRFLVGSDMVSSRQDYGIARTTGGYTFRETNEGSIRAGLHSNSSNDLLLKCGSNSEKMRILNGGNVGIGTTSPALLSGDGGRVLHIAGTANPEIVLERTTSGTEAKASIRITDTEDFRIAVKDGSASTIDALAIDSATGNVGIGTNTPETRLQVGGGTANSANVIKFGKRVSSTNSNLPLIGHHGNGTGSGIAICATSSAGQIHFFTGNNSAGFGTGDNAQRMVIDQNGNVGIGAASPSTTLNVSGRSDLILTGSPAAHIGGGVYYFKIGQTGVSSSPIINAIGSNVAIPFQINGSEKMRIDQNGDVAIGTTAAGGNTVKVQLTDDNSDAFVVKGGSGQGRTNITVDAGNTTSTASTSFRLRDSSGNTVASLFFMNNADDLIIGTQKQGGEVRFNTSTASNNLGSVYRAKFDQNGNFHLGGSSNSYGGKARFFSNNDGTATLSCVNQSTGSTVRQIDFFKGTSTSRVGSIQSNASATAFNTSSDYRLKENAVAISDGITRLKTLKPYRFNFKVDKSTTVDGFFAHEVTPAVPEAITGEKDALDSNGNIDPQSIDQSKLVPLLTAALQEAIAKIETLETKVAALEAA